MNGADMACPHCGEMITGGVKASKKKSRSVVIGSLIGLVVGAIFDYLYFYIGKITDYFTLMPVIHLIACILLGALAGWVIGKR